MTAHDENELGLELPELDDLPHPAQFRRAAENYQQLSQLDRDHGIRFWKDQAPEIAILCVKCNKRNRGRVPQGADRKEFLAKLRCGNAKCKAPFESSATEPFHTVALTPERLETLLETTREAAQLIPPDPHWSAEAIMAGLKGGPHREPWDNLVAEIDALTKLAGETKELILRHNPSIAAAVTLDEAESRLVEIQQHFATGGSLSFWSLLTKPAWKKLIAACAVEGSTPAKKEHFTALHAHVRLTVSRNRVITRWERMVSTSGGVSKEDLGVNPEAVLEQFRAELIRLLNWHSDKWQPIQTELDEIGLLMEQIIEGIPPITSATGPILRIRTAATQNLPPILTARASKIRWEEAKTFIDSLTTRLKSAPRKARSEHVAGLHTAVETLDADKYSIAFDGLSVLLNKRKLLARRKELLSKLAASAPGWAAAIEHRRKPHDGSIVPDGIQQAWLWRQLHDEIELRNSVSAEELQARLETLTGTLQTTTAELIDKRAWAAQVDKTSHTQRQALTGWVETIRRIGRGTGRRAPRLEVEARKLMGDCRSAVPVWIMPLSRVVENFDPAKRASTWSWSMKRASSMSWA
ncbi:MAG: hypothetical protein M0D55_15080 [Elusimicrobiota bacterium]|nr:MAG: hypothetical protein M0D55_15080 [Elusimicrobiota bacterium]